MANAPAKTIEFLFDFGSPTTYLAHTQLPRIAADTGARIDYVPMLLGGVFKATGNQSPVMVPAKGRWMGGDLARFARRYRVPFTFNPYFPINTLTLMRGAVGLQMRQPDRSSLRRRDVPRHVGRAGEPGRCVRACRDAEVPQASTPWRCRRSPATPRSRPS